MKKLLLIAFTVLSIHAIAQTNNYPTAGDVTIYNYSPSLILQRNTTVGGFTEGIQTRLQDGTDNWYFGALHTGQWIVSKGNYANAKLTILDNGNVGIGTDNPSGKLHIEAGYPSIYITSTDPHPYAALRGNNGTWLFGYGNVTGMEDISIGTQDGTGQRTLTLAAGGSAKVKILANGNTGIGTTNPAYKLDVLGTIRAKEVLVNLDGGADFVFEKDYKLLPIEHVANYVQENKHLPDIPSANEMVKNGVSMGDMQVKLLQKVEELTLYAIQQNKKIENQETDCKILEAKLVKQENQYNALLEKVEMLTKQIEKK